MKYRFSLLEDNEELPSARTNQVLQQRNGFLWIATRNGLYRYDGTRYLVFRYQPGSSRHITNDFVTDLVEDQSGKIWVATEEGLNVIHTDGTVQHFLHDANDASSLPDNWVTELYEDNGGRMWIGMGTGLALFDEQSGSFRSAPLEPIDNTDTPYVTVNAIVEDGHGRLWLATNTGIGQFDAASMDFSWVEPTPGFSGAVWDSMISSEGNVWFGTDDSGLFRFSPQSGDWQLIDRSTSSSPLMRNSVTSLAQDSNGTIWIGHERGGITTLNPGTMESYFIPYMPFVRSGLPSMYTNDIYVDQRGTVWVSTDDGLAYYLPSREGTIIYRHTPDANSLSSPVVWATVPAESRVFLASAKGVDLLHPERATVERIAFHSTETTPDTSNEVWDIDLTKAGNLWVAHEAGLSFITMATGDIETYSSTSTPALAQDDGIYRLYAGDEDSVWFAGRDCGLCRFSKEEGTVESYLDRPESDYIAGGNFPYDITRDAQGSFYIATTNGLYRVDTTRDSVRHYQLSSDRTHLRIFSIEFDANGNLWAGTEGLGLGRLRFDENGQLLEKVFFDSTQPDFNLVTNVLPEKHGVLFTTLNRIQYLDYTTERLLPVSAVIDERGWRFLESSISIHGEKIYVGSNHGLLEIDTRGDYVIRDVPPTVLAAVTVGRNRLEHLDFSAEESLTLSENDVYLDFSTLAYGSPDKMHYRYRMEGLSDEWIYGGTTAFAFFSDLAPGTYRFSVQGGYGDGEWSSRPAQLEMTVVRPLWHYLMAILCVVLGGFALYTIRQSRLQAAERYRVQNFDSLTGLANQQKFMTTLMDLTRTEEPDTRLAVAAIRIDYFRNIDSLVGIKGGEEILLELAQRLRAALEQEQMIARLGDNEFGIILPVEPDSPPLDERVRSIQGRLSAKYAVAGRRLSITTSIGVSHYPDDGNSHEDLLAAAKAALGEAVKINGDSIYEFDSRLMSARLRSIEIEGRLPGAISKSIIDVFFQPKVSSATGKADVFEALLRWNDKRYGWISPAEFVEIAERSGQIIALGSYVFNQSCKQLAQWQSDINPDIKVAVNVSAVQLYDEGFITMVDNALSETGVSGDALHVEVTESVLASDQQTAIQKLLALKERGLKIVLDDFGTGFSSLDYLTSLPIDILKIDKSLIDHVPGDPNSEIVMRHTIRMAHELGIKVVAEGVENLAQFDYLVSQHCDRVQGFLFSRPVCASEAELMIGVPFFDPPGNDTTITSIGIRSGQHH